MAPKRKASNSLSSNKQKKTSNQKKSAILSVEEIQNLGDQIRTSSKHYNNFVQLLEQYTHIKKELSERESEEIETIGRQLSITLYKCFQYLLKNDEMKNKKSHDDKKKMVVKWLLDKYDAFKKIINEFIVQRLAFETSLQVDLLEIGLNLVKLESACMKRYNLEYPDFYTKLYSLLTPNLLYTRYRSRFFRLCDLFLSSTHLSANLIASFIKKLARLSITSSASGVVIVIPFIYNLLKRHPSCMIMLHNPDISAAQYEDTFNNDETDPLKTGAMGSSLWELEALMSHYHPNIATLAKIFGEPFKKLNYNLEDFLDWSYISLLDSEKNRRYKTLVALEFEEWDMLFDAKDRPDSTSVYAKGWCL